MGLLKESIDAQKLRGGYYTPKEIANFLSNWAIQPDVKRILEPSCGDGIFIETAILRLKEIGFNDKKISDLIKGVELIGTEAIKAQARAKRLGVNPNIIVNSDFFDYLKSNGEIKFDVVLGNPPFIRYQNFPEEHRVLAIEMMKKLGLKPNKLTNIWVPFLTISSSLLTDKGKLGMVIPAELFQVKYAAETRMFLSEFFQRITIITFRKLVFQGVQQEIVLLLCEKQVNNHRGIRVIECKNIDDVNDINFAAINGSHVKSIDHNSDKWTKYFLSQKEIDLLKRLKNDPRVISCNDIMDVDVGIVTGRNEFFMMKKDLVNEWNLKNYTRPVISRSNQLKGIEFYQNDFNINSNAQYATHLFVPPDVNFEDLPLDCKKYIEYGESKNFHKGYKCRIRKKWYITPTLWIPDAFALRQVADYPKIILNDTEASSTDTIHRVRFKDGVDGQLVAMSFINSLSFAFSEIVGRSYGGGVLTFEPTEIEEIQIPSLENLNIDFNEIDQLIRQRKIEQALDIVDNALLIQKHGFTKEEVNRLRGIWKKLSKRRATRKKSKN